MDALYSATAYAELESLLEQRRQITEKNLHLLEHCGQQGTHSLQREILKAEIGGEFRESFLQEEGTQPTESRIKQSVAADPRYRSFVDQICRDRREWFRVKEQLDAITLRIRFLLQGVCSAEEGIETRVGGLPLETVEPEA